MNIDINLCADLCRLSYAPDLPEGFMDVDGFLCDLRFGVKREAGITYVAFRGSDGLLNWVRNFRVLGYARTSGGHLVHRGFYGAFLHLRRYVKVAGPTVFTGHSLGGDIARIFGLEHKSPAITFGAARCFWQWWGKLPDEGRHYSVICDDDPVPMLPRVSFRHDYMEPSLVLADDDGRRIQTRDHKIDVYVERLKIREEKEWLAFSQP